MPDDWLTPDDVAGLLGVSRSTVYNWLRDSPPLPSHRKGGVRRFRRDEVEAWFVARDGNTKPAA